MTYHDPWKLHQDECEWEVHFNWLNFSVLSVENTYIQKCYFSFFFLFSLYFFFAVAGEVELQAPTGLEVSTQLELWTAFLPHEFGGRVSQNDISTFNFFRNFHPVEQMCFIGTAKWSSSKGAWVMFWYNMVRDHCMKLIPTDNHNLSQWKLAYNICV